MITLADAGFLEPLDDTSAGVIPEGTESLYEVDGEIYGQPTSLSPVGFVYNPAAAEEVGVDEFPATFDDLLKACTTARGRRQELHRARRLRLVQHGAPRADHLGDPRVRGDARLERAARGR